MEHYNTLGEVVYNEKVKHWRFRVKIIRIYHFYSYVTGKGPHHVYVLADEHGTKMKMTIYDIYGDRFRGLEKQEGKWVEIFIVEVGRARSGFKVAKSKFTLTATGDTQIYIIDPLNDQLYFEFKGFHEIPHMSYKERNFSTDTMGVVFKTETHFDDPEGPKMVFYIRDNIESQIKCVATWKHAYAFREGFENRRGRRQVIVVLRMWRVHEYFSYSGPIEECLQDEGNLSDFRFNPRLPEVEEFRQSVNNSDPYVRKNGAIGPL
ncbi:unnamed protein product [Eruca vesicaria subsp. sativa]|uniref:Replication protein A 70 kDa DNA-binding subunit B/D first OB fold domain-containing protein n=1 Tax=Eruca vesicaria subsp. sativa TaxID=29727 RepID=A0ABC8LEI7_ERUVS|nr:unnamed protein product [Eruca vesicaria subsp. sativa]